MKSLKIEVYKITKFGFVGSLGMGIDIGVTSFLKEIVLINLYFANAGGFFLAVFNNYILNKYWTFKEKNKISAFQFFSFLIVAIIGLLFSTISIFLFHDKMEMNFYTAKVLSILIVSIWNYLMTKFIVF